MPTPAAWLDPEYQARLRRYSDPPRTVSRVVYQDEPLYCPAGCPCEAVRIVDGRVRVEISPACWYHR